jgi:glycerol uptake facilitator-like aquaporin
MKKAILFALLGGIILFAWQFIAWAMPNFHKQAQEYAPAQDEILQAIENSGLKQGMYVLGQPDPKLSRPEYDAAMKKYEGKPWAVLNYREKNVSSMVMNMIRGFIMMVLISLIFFWLVRQQKDPTLMKRILLGLGIGLIGFMFIPYTYFIWFKAPDIWAYLLDGFVPWIILGWLGHKLA